MAKCYVTGVELPLEGTCVLDIGAAYRALRDLRQRVSAVERLIYQLCPSDEVEIYDAKKRETITRKDRRLVSPSIAKAFSIAYPEKELFLTWPEWKSNRIKIKDALATNINTKNVESVKRDNVKEKKHSVVNDGGQSNVAYS